MIFALLFSAFAFAAEKQEAPAAERSTFEKYLEADQSVDTKERWVEIDGVRYREVEYKGEHYYMNFKNPGSADISCHLKSPSAAARRMELGIQITKRTRAFVQLLKETCETRNGREIVTLQLDPRIGFTLPDDTKSLIKNKKVYLSPTGPGFSGEW